MMTQRKSYPVAIFHGRKDRPLSFTVRQLAALVHGSVVGDGDLTIQSARTLQDAQAGDITFLENSKQGPRLEQSQACAALVPRNLLVPGKALIQVADPLMAFTVVFQQIHGKAATAPLGIDPRAVIDPSAQIGADATIGPFVCIGPGTVIGKRCQLRNGVTIGANCHIGDDADIHPHVVLYDDTVVGDRALIHANAVLGADGFGYRFQQGRYIKVPQLSRVIVGSDVEIGACSCIDRGAFEPTRVGDGTKIDNLVQIAHNVQIGKHNILAAQVGIAGSSTTGNYVLMGGQAGLSDHVNVGDGAQFGAKTGVFQDVPAGKRMFLYPAHEEREAGRIMACIRKLPAMRKDLLRVLKQLGLGERVSSPAIRDSEAPAA
jgi:UDP-3-O-[3-hydroxymyristoyl] glucosamine N-acyltransferase